MDTRKLKKHSAGIRKDRVAMLHDIKVKLGVVKPVPPGWLTTAQIAAKLGVTQRTAGYLVKEWMGHGKCEMQKFKTSEGLMVYRTVNHFKFAQEVADALGL